MEQLGAFWTVALRTQKSTPIPLGGTRSLVSNLLLTAVYPVDCVPVLHHDDIRIQQKISQNSQGTNDRKVFCLRRKEMPWALLINPRERGSVRSQEIKYKVSLMWVTTVCRVTTVCSRLLQFDTSRSFRGAAWYPLEALPSGSGCLAQPMSTLYCWREKGAAA